MDKVIKVRVVGLLHDNIKDIGSLVWFATEAPGRYNLELKLSISLTDPYTFKVFAENGLTKLFPQDVNPFCEYSGINEFRIYIAYRYIYRVTKNYFEIDRFFDLVNPGNENLKDSCIEFTNETGDIHSLFIDSNLVFEETFSIPENELIDYLRALSDRFKEINSQSDTRARVWRYLRW